MTRARRPWSANRVGAFCVLAGLTVLIGGYNYPRGWWPKEFVLEVYPNSGADLIGASIVILVIDRFARQREEEERRHQLVRECGSADHAVANRALLELETRRWLADGTLAEAQLVGANLAQARLETADLTQANLVGATLKGANLSRATLLGARLGGANLSHAVLEWAVLDGAAMSGANLHRADAARATLARADLAHADLSGADLTRADLSGANLDHADLSGANLSSATLDAATLRSVRYDHLTRWPEGFHPPGEVRRGQEPGTEAEAGRL